MAFALSAPCRLPTRSVVSRKSAAPAARRAAVRVSASAERKQFSLEIPAGVTAAAGAMLASPLAAQAEVTPSLKNLVQSVIAGGVVLVAIIVAVTAVSGFDPITRGK